MSDEQNHEKSDVLYIVDELTSGLGRGIFIWWYGGTGILIALLPFFYSIADTPYSWSASYLMWLHGFMGGGYVGIRYVRRQLYKSSVIL